MSWLKTNDVNVSYTNTIIGKKHSYLVKITNV